MSQIVYQDGVRREWWDDATRTYTAYDEAGVPIVERPYTAEENAVADADAAANVLAANKVTVDQRLAEHFTEIQTLVATTNAEINDNPAAEIKKVARAVRRLIRVALQQYDGSD